MKNIADPARNKRSPFTTFAESLCSAWQEEAPTGCPPTGNVLRKVGVGLSTLQACRGNQRGNGALMNALTSSVFSPGSTGSICAFFRISYDHFDSLMHVKTVVAPNHCVSLRLVGRCAAGAKPLCSVASVQGPGGGPDLRCCQRRVI